jgi:hypothetical protein
MRAVDLKKCFGKKTYIKKNGIQNNDNVLPWKPIRKLSQESFLKNVLGHEIKMNQNNFQAKPNKHPPPL